MRLEIDNDFILAIADFGFTPEEAKRISEIESDQIEMPHDDFKFKVAKSSIEGLGIIAIDLIKINEIIGPARLNGKRTPLGRYTNHAKKPNAFMKMNKKNIDLIALTSIQPDTEITVDYRQVGKEQNLPRMGY